MILIHTPHLEDKWKGHAPHRRSPQAKPGRRSRARDHRSRRGAHRRPRARRRILGRHHALPACRNARPSRAIDMVEIYGGAAPLAQLRLRLGPQRSPRRAEDCARNEKARPRRSRPSTSSSTEIRSGSSARIPSSVSGRNPLEKTNGLRFFRAILSGLKIFISPTAPTSIAATIGPRRWPRSRNTRSPCANASARTAPTPSACA